MALVLRWAQAETQAQHRALAITGAWSPPALAPQDMELDAEESGDLRGVPLADSP
jgi:hypothetical protein